MRVRAFFASGGRRKREAVIKERERYDNAPLLRSINQVKQTTGAVYSGDITLARTALISYLARKEEKGATAYIH